MTVRKFLESMKFMKIVSLNDASEKRIRENMMNWLEMPFIAYKQNFFSGAKRHENPRPEYSTIVKTSCNN